MRIKAMVLALGVVGLATVGFIASPSARGGSSETAKYKITSWPDHAGPEKSYADEVETHLNRMASDGWKFHSEMVAQSVRMMVFVRD